VTGGMHKKVALMLKALKLSPHLIIEIFSGDVSGNIYKSLKGIKTGTNISV
jgi:isopentenyl phosphate kinase